ncbi:MAG: hypothetical protein ACKV1O_15200, partial [Saprospiraceae bacterium]
LCYSPTSTPTPLPTTDTIQSSFTIINKEDAIRVTPNIKNNYTIAHMNTNELPSYNDDISLEIPTMIKNPLLLSTGDAMEHDQKKNNNNKKKNGISSIQNYNNKHVKNVAIPYYATTSVLSVVSNNNSIQQLSSSNDDNKDVIIPEPTTSQLVVGEDVVSSISVWNILQRFSFLFTILKQWWRQLSRRIRHNNNNHAVPPLSPPITLRSIWRQRHARSAVVKPTKTKTTRSEHTHQCDHPIL